MKLFSIPLDPAFEIEEIPAEEVEQEIKRMAGHLDLSTTRVRGALLHSGKVRGSFRYIADYDHPETAEWIDSLTATT
jgi:hypothetical protein